MSDALAYASLANTTKAAANPRLRIIFIILFSSVARLQCLRQLSAMSADR
jgi:hypothetical protein